MKPNDGLFGELLPRVSDLERDMSSLKSTMEGFGSALERQSVEFRDTSRAIFAKLDALGKDVTTVRGAGSQMFYAALTVVKEAATLFALVVAGIIWIATSYESESAKRIREDTIARQAVFEFRLNRIEKVTFNDPGASNRGS